MTASLLWRCLLPLLFSLLKLHALPPNASCPAAAASANCLCQPGPTLVCSCSSNSAKLRLNSKSLPAHLALLVIHSCASVVVPAGTFRGKSVLDQLKFLDLGSLHFEAGAFRSIRRSPRLLLIQNVSRIPALLPLAFAGLGRLQHFWWRNVSIDRVHARAFAKLWHIDYLYFHQTHIKRVDSSGFGKIPGLGHLFFRDRIRLDWLADGAFSGSRVEELVLEDVLLKGSPGVFNGLQAKRLRMLNCRWGGGRRRRARRNKTSKSKEENDGHGTRLEEILIRNCSLTQMPSLGFRSQSLHVDNCWVGRWLAPTARRNKKTEARVEGTRLGQISRRSVPAVVFPNLKNIGSVLRVLNSRIRIWEAPGLGWTEARVEGTRLGQISRRSVPAVTQPVPILQLRFTNCRLRLVSDHSFAGVLFTTFQLLNSSVARWHGSPLAQAKVIGDILVAETRVGVWSDGGGSFAKLNASALRLLRSSFEGQLGPNPFGQTKLNVLEVRQCHFDHSLGDGLLEGLAAAEQRVEFMDSEWLCGDNEVGQQCGIEQLLLTAPPLPHWLISGNRCLSSANLSSPTVTASPCLLSSGMDSPLLCRHLGLLQECLCPSIPVGQQLVIPFRPLAQIRVLLLSDCPDSSVQLYLDGNSSQLQRLFAFRIGQLQLGSLPASLRYVHVLHSRLSVLDPRAFSSVRLSELHVLNGQLDGEAPAADSDFDWTRLGTVRLERTEVGAGWQRALARAGGHFNLGVEERRTAGVKDEDQKEGEEEQRRGGGREQQQKRCARRQDCREKTTRNGCWSWPSCWPLLTVKLLLMVLVARICFSPS